jgi:hypothetical protein
VLLDGDAGGIALAVPSLHGQLVFAGNVWNLHHQGHAIDIEGDLLVGEEDLLSGSKPSPWTITDWPGDTRSERMLSSAQRLLSTV